MDYINNNLEEIIIHLTNNNNGKGNRIIKVHTQNLRNGDYSFPIPIDAWAKYIADEKTDIPITNCQENIPKFISELVQKSNAWVFKINHAAIIRDHCFIRLKRDSAFRLGVSAVLKYKSRYGLNLQDTPKTFHILYSEKSDDEITLTQLRVKIVREACENFLIMSGHKMCDSQNEANCTLCFVQNKQKSDIKDNLSIMQCGAVLVSGMPKSLVLGSELKRKRSLQMQLLAQHKYGMRFTDDLTTISFCKRLGESAVRFEMLQTKPTKPLNINFENQASCSSKGISFILYNCARIYAIKEKFESQVTSGSYAALPDFENIDCDIYKEELEWELLFCYVLRFPCVVKECLQDILNGAFNPHYLCNFLSALVGVFSIYYRNVRILITGHEHIAPLIHSRMYLLLALDQVLRNGLALLAIAPLDYM